MDNESTVSEKNRSSSRWIWIVIGVVILLLILGAIIVGIIYFLRPTNDTIPGCYNGDGATNGQTAAFRVTNHCCFDVWVEARAGACSTPLPGYSNTIFKVGPGDSVDFSIPNVGLAATRFWAKWGCDDSGLNCIVGNQDQIWIDTGTCPLYGCSGSPCPTGGGCPTGGCSVPIDSLFEATWGCSLTGADISQCNVNPSTCSDPNCTYFGCSGCEPLNNITSFDTSQVNGWTFPYNLWIKGSTGDLAAANNGNGAVNINASALNQNRCPTTEDLSSNGAVTSVTDNSLDPPVTYTTTSVDLRLLGDNSIIGCMSPCTKLNYPAPYGFNQSKNVPPANLYCCPTPASGAGCQLPACVTPEECSSGPVATSQYVQAVHSMTNNTVYAYAYDDALGLQSAPAGTVIYEWELCGSNSSAYPYPI